jgi:hypothetical protein
MQCSLAAPAVPTVQPQSAATFVNIQKGVPLFSAGCALFCRRKNLNSFIVIRFRTLCSKSES